MLKRILYTTAFFAMCLCLHSQALDSKNVPHLQKKGTATQLIVEGKPYLILGGELGNSSASSNEYMSPIWSKLKKLHMNTVLAPVYWELIEPAEGKYDFDLVDSMIFNARRNNLKIVFLWFGVWKNSMSCYAPAWVKQDLSRFPRAKTIEGSSVEILSPFSENVLNADINVFSALMRHIRQVDEKNQTVIMIQVENEIGMLPEARDKSEVANELYQSNVPVELTDYLKKTKSLQPNISAKLKTGSKKSGNWTELFGDDINTEEIFMAWYYATFIEKLTQAGKAEYPLPMYVNAALNRPNYKPGQYPSAGPLPHLMDIWKAAAPSIDFLSPDIYFPGFKYWSGLYKNENNPLFIPENQLGAFNGANALFTIGQHDAIGYSPFSVESIEHPENSNLSKSYEILDGLSPLVLEKQGTNSMVGVLLDSINEKSEFILNGFKLKFRHEKNWLRPSQAIPEEQQKVGCIVIATAPDEFIVAGSGILVTFEPLDTELPIAGFLSIDELRYENGIAKICRRLNGDQNHQGRHVPLPFDTFGIQKVNLYRYK